MSVGCFVDISEKNCRFYLHDLIEQREKNVQIIKTGSRLEWSRSSHCGSDGPLVFPRKSRSNRYIGTNISEDLAASIFRLVHSDEQHEGLTNS